MQTEDRYDNFPTLVAFHNDSLFRITEILNNQVKCESESGESFWADVLLHKEDDFKYEYIIYKDKEYRLNFVKSYSAFKEMIQDKNKNILTKESVMPHAVSLRRWCLSHDIVQAPDGSPMLMCNGCPFITKDEDGDGDCMINYPLDWKIEI